MAVGEGNRKKALRYILARLHDAGTRDLEQLKREAAAKHFLAGGIRNSEILSALRKQGTRHGTRNTKHAARDTGHATLLLKRPMRTLSGVTPVAVMIRPEGSCTHGCIYCPAAGKAAKSYTGHEPAALRARQAGFDPGRQVRSRLAHYSECGHPTSKCEIIVMGGTFLETRPAYRVSFVKGIYDALNNKKSKSLALAEQCNETARHRAVGITIETRPDVCGPEHIDEMLAYGATRVELGVQHPNDKIYAAINRGHKVADVIRATRLLKDSAFKVLYHLMPGLPGSNPKKDIAMAGRLFSDSRFRPDMLKIYPTLAIEGTKLNKMALAGEYAPYTTGEAAETISEFYRHIPEYARVMRIQRDIPANLIAGGVKNSNLRQLVEQRLAEKGIIPKEIRSREVGLRGVKYNPRDFSIRRLDYEASGGKEIFISSENAEGLIAGFLRLRIPGKSHRREITPGTALVRELHVYGKEADVGAGERGGAASAQHRGIGSALLREAESLARDVFAKEKMIVISGVGAREYYLRMGYSRDGPYMARRL